MENSEKIILRVDGSIKTGLGHVYRSIAFALIIREEYDVLFLVRKSDCNLSMIIKSFGFSVYVMPIDISWKEETKWIVSSFLPHYNVKAVVLDGYKFVGEYQLAIKNSGVKVVYIDGINSGYYYADAVINPNLYASDLEYKRESYTKLYLGPKYSLVREDFYGSHFNNRIKVSEVNILIAFGGTDQYNLTKKILELLVERIKVDDKRNFIILLGSGYNFHDELNSYLLKNNLKNVSLRSSLNDKELVELYSIIDCAICPGGTMLYELFHFSIPVLTGFFVDNQILNAKYVEKFKLGINIGNFLTVDSLMLNESLDRLIFHKEEYSINLLSYFDKKQSDRIVHLIKMI